MRIYLDTSVFSALFDNRDRSRRALTQQFWSGPHSSVFCSSDVAVLEIMQAGEAQLRNRMLAAIQRAHIFPRTEECEKLADALRREQVFTTQMWEDSLHVAIAVVNRCDILASWNFRHLVNRNRRILVNRVCKLEGYPEIQILAPPEI